MGSSGWRIMLSVIESRRACNASKMRIVWAMQRSFILYHPRFSDCIVSVLSDFPSHARSFRLLASALALKW